jgi:hypothetical protein
VYEGKEKNGMRRHDTIRLWGPINNFRRRSSTTKTMTVSNVPEGPHLPLLLRAAAETKQKPRLEKRPATVADDEDGEDEASKSVR